jgi:hypothetical protein
MTPPHRPEEGDVYFLDPRSTRISRNAFGRLVLTVAGGVDQFEDVRPIRAFPLSAPDRDVSLTDAEGREIGVIPDVNALDPESRQTLVEELDTVYLSTRVHAIKSVQSQYGVGTWELETDRGPRTAYLRDRGDVRALPDGRIILTDVHGVKYEIADPGALDERSRSFIEAEM